MKLKKRNLIMLWRSSQYDSVREVAQNPDIMRLIMKELDPMFQYNRVVKEYNDPRFKAHFRRLWQKCGDRHVHPGRWLVSVVYPSLNRWPYWSVKHFAGEDINLHGCVIRTQEKRWPADNNFERSYDSVSSFTHEDLNRILTSYGYKSFASKKKGQKIHMLMKH